MTEPNKPMSDTPRTDAEAVIHFSWLAKGAITPMPTSWKEFARQLERELTTTQQHLKQLQEVAKDMRVTVKQLHISNHVFDVYDSLPPEVKGEA